MIKRILNFILAPFRKKKQIIDPKDYLVSQLEDEPDDFENGIIYLIGESGNEWLIAFKCPCDCGDVVKLNTLKEASPCWSYELSTDSVTIKPSINRMVGCKSHFFVTKSKVKW